MTTEADVRSPDVLTAMRYGTWVVKDSFVESSVSMGRLSDASGHTFPELKHQVRSACCSGIFLI